jgi:membrane protein
MSLKEFAKKLYKEINDDAVSDSAAQLAYYLLFALFPFLVFLVTLTAYLPGIHGATDALLARARYVMPDEAVDILTGHITSVVSKKQDSLLTFGFLLTFWSASRGIDAIRKAMNLAYDVPESRPFWRTQGSALLMTLASAILIPVAIALFLLGSKAGLWLAHKFEIDAVFYAVWAWGRWPIVSLIVMLAAALSYYFLPDVKQKFKFITPGSIFASVAWLASTWGFTQYVEHFGNYNATYGSLGAVMVLMLWLYLSGFILVIGGEINAIIEHASREGKQKGARDVGEAPVAADMPVTAGAAKSAASGKRLHWRFWQRTHS